VALSADGHLLASGSHDGTVKLWEPYGGTHLATLRAERRYERLDITGLTGITAAEQTALLALGAVEQPAQLASRAPRHLYRRRGKHATYPSWVGTWRTAEGDHRPDVALWRRATAELGPRASRPTQPGADSSFLKDRPG
jgi:hypothetical protein